MTTPTPEQIAKLPKWAQEYIQDIEADKSIAEGTVKRFQDEQTESPIYVHDWASKDAIKRYVRCEHGQLVIRHAGVEARILLARPDDGQRLYGIEIVYSPMDTFRLGDGVALMPRGIGTLQLVAKENLR